MKIRFESEKKVLENGIRLIITPMSGAASVGISIFVGTGARFEEPQRSGISHFLEHLVFKGTKKYQNQVLISETIEGRGGILNGYTTSQLTSYWAKVVPENFGSAFDVLSDMVLAPLLRPEDIESEKGVVIEEIRMKNDNPMEESLELAQQSLWGQTQLGTPVLGTEETIRNLDRQSLFDYHRRRYMAPLIVVSVAGDFSESAVLSLVEEKFGRLGKSNLPVSEAPSVFRGNFVIKEKDTAQAHIVLTFPTLSFLETGRYALDLISSLLGSGMSSRLFLNVRDKGLAYVVHCYNEYYADTGGFVTYAGVEKERLDLAVKTILMEFRKLGQETIPESELQKAKEKIRGPLAFSLEDPFKVSEHLGYQEAAFGKFEDPQVYLKNLMEIGSFEVNRLGRELLVKENLSLAAVSPFSKQDFEKILKSS